MVRGLRGVVGIARLRFAARMENLTELEQLADDFSVFHHLQNLAGEVGLQAEFAGVEEDVIEGGGEVVGGVGCLLYTSDAADE